MFTGIVTHRGFLVEVEDRPGGLRRLVVRPEPEPAPPIVALVRNAIEQTNDWYGQLRADPPVSESGWT